MGATKRRKLLLWLNIIQRIHIIDDEVYFAVWYNRCTQMDHFMFRSDDIDNASRSCITLRSSIFIRKGNQEEAYCYETIYGILLTGQDCEKRKHKISDIKRKKLRR